MNAIAERIWRARKTHTWIDAQLHPSSDEQTFEVRFYYDGELVLARSWPTRDAALLFASQQLRELQRAGWNTHW